MLDTVRAKPTNRIVLALDAEHRKVMAACLIDAGFPESADCQYFWYHELQQLKHHRINGHNDTLLISSRLLEKKIAPEMISYLQAAAVICIHDELPSEPEKLMRMGVDEFLPVDKINEQTLSFAIHTVRYRHHKRETERPLQLDEVTALPGRGSFESQLEKLVQNLPTGTRPGTGLAIFLLALKGVEQLNNHYGMKTGDQVLLRAKERIQHIAGQKVFMARLGGNQFGLILEKVTHGVQLSRIALSLVETVSIPLIVGKDTAVLGCNIGIAQWGRGGEDAESLMKSAAIALKSSRTEMADNFKFYSKEMELESRGRFMLEKQLRKAIPANELELYYQPRIDMQRNCVVGAEALVRWNHPELGLLSPDKFIPLAEESGMIIELGYWILERACQDWVQLAEWGITDIHLAINLSFKQFYDPDLVEHVREIMGRYPINTRCIEFELTESTVLHDEQKVLEAMHALSKDGIQFSLDDFGTGYSSFAHIAELPITLLKVDKSFVMGMDTQITRAEIVDSIISLAHRLDLKVVGEGVENPSQKNRLVDMNCDQGQGYLFSKPIPFDVLCTYLAERRRLAYCPL